MTMHAVFRSCLAAAGFAGLVAGCEYQPIGTLDRPEYRVDAARGEYGVQFSPGTAAFAPGEAARLAGFLRGVPLRSADEVILTAGPSGSHAIDQARIAAATGVIAEVGLRARLSVVDQRTDATVAPGPNTVLVEAVSPGQLLVACPGRYLDATEQAYAGPTPRLGCANAVNLAFMAADRKDLVRPRVLGPSDGATSSAAVIRYRTDTIKMPPPVGMSSGG
jgi:type IV pilus biogenesis protein CpaD/CtpE